MHTNVTLAVYRPNDRDLIPNHASLQHIHSATPHEVRDLHYFDDPACRIKGDGLFTLKPNIPLAVYTADCMAIGISVGTSTLAVGIAAIHAGWRGLIEGVIENTINALHKQLPSPSALTHAHIYFAPSIRRCCFEVNSDCYHSFTEWAQHHKNTHYLKKKMNTWLLNHPNDSEKKIIDLLQCAKIIIDSCFKNTTLIFATHPDCTKCAPSKIWASYRREPMAKTRNILMLGLKDNFDNSEKKAPSL